MSKVVIKKINPVHIDDRGSISDIFNSPDPIHHIGLITFTAGAVRANHYHKHSKQYDYILSGKIELRILDRENRSAQVESFILEKGEAVIIPENIVHAYKALEPSEMIDMTTQSRAGSGYEDDVYRVDSLF